MAILFTILKILGIILLVVLVAALCLILLVLLAPIRYSFRGDIRDPRGSPEILHIEPDRAMSGRVEIRWLAGALFAYAAYEGGMSYGLRLLGFRVPVEKILGRTGKKEEDKKEKEEKEPRRPMTPDEKIEMVLQRIEKLYARLEDACRVLETEYGVRAREVLLTQLFRTVSGVLPRTWSLTGTLGLGDPARSAKAFAIQSVLYPLTCGHVAIDPEFEQYRYDLHGGGEGRIRLLSFVQAGLVILFNKDIRRLFRRLRRGPRRPSPSAESA